MGVLLGPTEATPGNQLDDTSYLCELASILARLVGIIGPQPGNLDSMDEETLMRISAVKNDFIKLNLGFLTHSSARVMPMRAAKRDRLLEIITQFFNDLDGVSAEKSPLASLLRSCLEGFVVGELFNTQVLIVEKTQGQEPADQFINYELFSPWSDFSVSYLLLPKGAQESRIIQAVRSIARSDLSARDLKHLLRSLQRADHSASQSTSHVRRAEVDLVNKDYAAALK